MVSDDMFPEGYHEYLQRAEFKPADELEKCPNCGNEEMIETTAVGDSQRGYFCPQCGGRIPAPAMWHPGDRCFYLYKGPHGMAVAPEKFPAVVLGVTKLGRVRIRATDTVNGGEFDAAVKPESLVEAKPKVQENGL